MPRGNQNAGTEDARENRSGRVPASRCARPGARGRHPAPASGQGEGGPLQGTAAHRVESPPLERRFRLAGGRPPGRRVRQAEHSAKQETGDRDSPAPTSVPAFQRRRVSAGVLCRVTDVVTSHALVGASATGSERSPVSRPQRPRRRGGLPAASRCRRSRTRTRRGVGQERSASSTRSSSSSFNEWPVAPVRLTCRASCRPCVAGHGCRAATAGASGRFGIHYALRSSSVCRPVSERTPAA